MEKNKIDGKLWNHKINMWITKNERQLPSKSIQNSVWVWNLSLKAIWTGRKVHILDLFVRIASKVLDKVDYLQYKKFRPQDISVIFVTYEIWCGVSCESNLWFCQSVCYLRKTLFRWACVAKLKDIEDGQDY